MYNWIILLYSRNKHNIINQLYLKKIKGIISEALLCVGEALWGTSFSVWITSLHISKVLRKSFMFTPLGASSEHIILTVA